MQTKQSIIGLLKQNEPYLAAEFGVRRIGLFGSFAKGKPGKSSDVDLIVEFERPIGLKFVDLVDYLENLLGRKVDVLTPAGLSNIRVGSASKAITQSIEYVKAS